MISSSLAAALGRRDLHYGWVVAAVTFLTMSALLLRWQLELARPH